jgi:hypothetical protein
MVIGWGLGIALLIVFRCVSIDDTARPRTDAGTVLTAALLVCGVRGQTLPARKVRAQVDLSTSRNLRQIHS